MSPITDATRNHKSLTRSHVWTSLREVALPDSRFHHDYSSFIADFQGSSQATHLLCSLPIYKSSPVIFIAPDNCLQELRHQALKDGKTVLCTTYGIRRGFWVLDPKTIEQGRWEVASLLDGMEKVGRHITLSQIRASGLKIPLMVTGAGAINMQGLRFGKGHGFFDLEFAMLKEIGVVGNETKVVGVVHECQVLDKKLVVEEWDVGCDFVVSDKRVIEVEDAAKPGCGIVWEKLREGMLEDIEPLGELKGILEGKRGRNG